MILNDDGNVFLMCISDKNKKKHWIDPNVCNMKDWNLVEMRLLKSTVFEREKHLVDIALTSLQRM